MIKRTILELLPSYLHKQRAIVIYGARRTGKTTILNSWAENLDNVRYINCDLIDGQEAFNFRSRTEISLDFGQYSHLLIDEAQRVADIGIKLKAIIDHLPQLQIIATGSSSLDLSSLTGESLTGRKFEFLVTPLSTAEIYHYGGTDDVKGGLHQRLIYGNYPEVYLEKSIPEEIIKEIAGSYLFKDILVYQNIKRPDLLKRLLIALALQTGSEVSYQELGTTVGLDRKTVEKYIWLLEQCFIIYRLGSFSRNLRNELKKAVKIYFWDNGIRNSLLNNFSPLDKRTDTGALWENYFITERRKLKLNSRAGFEHYFWRTSSQQEIDLIESENGELKAFELKWNPGKNHRISRTFIKGYESAETHIVTPANYLEYLV